MTAATAVAPLAAEARVGGALVRLLLAPPDGAAGTPATLRLRDRHRAVTLARALAHDLGLPHAALGRAPAGRPFLRSAPGVGLSLAHSGGWVAAALCADSPDVGVDVQEPRAVGERLVRWCCPPADADAVLAADDPAQAFAAAWVVREALGKATGQGLRARPFDARVCAADAGTWRGIAWARAATSPVPLAVAVRGTADAATWTWAPRCPRGPEESA